MNLDDFITALQAIKDSWGGDIPVMCNDMPAVPQTTEGWPNGCPMNGAGEFKPKETYVDILT